MRFSKIVFLSFFLILILSLLIVAHAQYQLKAYQQTIYIRQKITKKIGLPDLAITTAARYLRHYSLTDINTPFQDYPGSLDHFPAGFAYSPPNFTNFPVSFRLKPKSSD